MEIIIDKLIAGGQGIGRTPEGKAAFVWNALPGETVEVNVYKEKKHMLEGIATTILSASPHRQPPNDSHFMATSAWDIISYSEELRWKKEIANETFAKFAALPNLFVRDVQTDGVEYGYRNKIEYRFMKVKGKISLAVHQRGTRELIPAEQCILASGAINRVAKDILAWVEQGGIDDDRLHALVLRGNRAGEVIAGLMVSKNISAKHYPALVNGLVGFHVYKTTPEKTTLPIAQLHGEGKSWLQESIRGTSLSYALLSFFQVNPSVFEMALDDIADAIAGAGQVVDYYAGVGSIGIPLHESFSSARLVESNDDAVNCAIFNIESNGLDEQIEIGHSPTERMLEEIKPGRTIIVDPPRAGLHKSGIEKLNRVAPEKIVYLSCNVATQARDFAKLQEVYAFTQAQLYNFFPRTPHIESLIVLERKENS